jgi:hypothetical protein
MLSAGYVAYYLRSGPRIIDATSYYLQARALAAGYFSFPIPEPSGSFRGRFLVTPPGDTLAQAVIFPPGYPALLALGFVFRAPLVIGPLCAAALVVSTYALAQRASGRTSVALLAALLSVMSSALRYHTADTMSHAWAALLFTLVLFCALSPTRRYAVAAGLAAGWLFATRPVTGLVAIAVLTPTLIKNRAWPFAFALIPGLFLYSLHQKLATGSLFGSAQIAYYALADGPPGCFRYGFGSGIGCWFEHGDFVRAHLRDGYGPLEALGSTLRRLALHTSDICNVAPLALVVPFAIRFGWSMRPMRLVAAGVVGVILGYAPFYFDGNYPGGGARLFADALPLEHVLLALALDRMRIARFVVPLSLIGFALHTSHGHRALADREGGRPMYEPEHVTRHGVRRGIVFVNTDHGYNLGHDPGRLSAHDGIVVARLGRDAHDFLLWQKLGKPPAYRYRFQPGESPREPGIEVYVPRSSARIEAEREWPPLAVLEGWAHPAHISVSCAPSRQGLRFRTSERGRARLELDLPGVPARVRTSWVAVGDGNLELAARSGVSSATRSTHVRRGECIGLELALAPSDAERRLELEAAGAPAILDYIELESPAMQ